MHVLMVVTPSHAPQHVTVMVVVTVAAVLVMLMITTVDNR